MATSYITLSSLIQQFKGIIDNSNFSSAQLFYKNIIFNDEYRLNTPALYSARGTVINLFGGDEDTPTDPIISEFSTLKFGKHLGVKNYSFIVTELIVYQYKQYLSRIESFIATKILKNLSPNQRNQLIENLKTLQNNDLLPLISYTITEDNLAKTIVACFIHCCYCDEASAKVIHSGQRVYANIEILRCNNISQTLFESNFPKHKCNFTWDELPNPIANKALFLNKLQKLPDWDINYNVEMLLQLFLNSNGSPPAEKGYSKPVYVPRTPTEKATRREVEQLRAVLKQLDNDNLFKFNDKLIEENLTISERLTYATDLLISQQDERNITKDKKNGNEKQR